MKVYEIPELQIDLFRVNDVLTASDNDIDAGDLGWFGNSVSGDLKMQ